MDGQQQDERNFWMVGPDTDKLTFDVLGRETWIEVKRELSIGEQRRVDTAGFRGMSQGQKSDDGTDEKNSEIGIDWKSQTFVRSLVYITDWSLTDPRGNKLAIKMDTLENMRKPVYKAIEKALNAHIDAQEKEKKD